MKRENMPSVADRKESVRGLRFAVVVSRFNEFVTESLLKGATEALRKSGVEEQDVSVFRVPGAFEIPQMARKIAEQRDYDAIICIGALIRGKTRHFEIISDECARGIQQVSANYGIPVTFGVITAETIEQANERAGSLSDNRGWEAAEAAIEMALLFRQFR